LIIGGAPRYSPSRIMQICKSILAIQYQEFPKIKDEELWGGEFWTDGGQLIRLWRWKRIGRSKKVCKNQEDVEQFKAVSSF